MAKSATAAPSQVMKRIAEAGAAGRRLGGVITFMVYSPTGILGTD
jgi:hypothetical protein